MDKPANMGAPSNSTMRYDDIRNQIVDDIKRGMKLDWSRYHLEGLSEEERKAIEDEVWLVRLNLQGENDPTTKPKNVSEDPGTSFPTIPGYKFIREIGRGGMGIVYEGNTNHGQSVALKKLRVGEAATNEEIQRFLDEGMTLGRLNHHGIVTVHRFLFHANQFFLVMEYVNGRSLAQVLKEEGTYLPSEVSGVILQIAEALAHIHDGGVVHRDLKPANILYTNKNQTKLTDFGLAIVDKWTRFTQPNTIPGTIEYMAPEQVQCNLCGPESDMWAIGIILYELLIGTTPFAHPNCTNDSIRNNILNSDPPSLKSLCPEIDQRLEKIYAGCLKREPSDRLTAKDLISLLNSDLLPTISPTQSAATSPAPQENNNSPTDAVEQTSQLLPTSVKGASEANPFLSNPSVFPFLVGVAAFLIGVTLWLMSDWVGCGKFQVKLNLVTEDGGKIHRSIWLGYQNQYNYGPWYLSGCVVVFWLIAQIFRHDRLQQQDNIALGSQPRVFKYGLLSVILLLFVAGSILTEWEPWEPYKKLGLGWVQAESFEEYANRLRGGESEISLQNRRFDHFQVEDEARRISRVRATQVVLTHVNPENLRIISHNAMVVFVILVKGWAGFWEGMVICVSLWTYWTRPVQRKLNDNSVPASQPVVSYLFWISILGGVFSFLRFVANAIKGSFGLSDLDKLTSLLLLVPGLVAFSLFWETWRKGNRPRIRVWVLVGIWCIVWAIVVKSLLGHIAPESSYSLRMLWKQATDWDF